MGRLDSVGYDGARAGEIWNATPASALAAAEIKHADQHADQRLKSWFVGGA
jgi:hypothetical protein